MYTNQLTGTLTKEQARINQLQKYQQDALKHAKKQKEKENKKREERWQRYSHVDVGQQLSPDHSSDLQTVRLQQQNHYDKEGLQGYIRELERENARLRREEEKRHEKLKKLPVDTGRSLPGSSQLANTTPKKTCQFERLPFERTSVNLPSPSLSEDNLKNANNRNQKDNSNATDEKKKEEEFRREMRHVREKMQIMYSQGVNENN